MQKGRRANTDEGGGGLSQMLTITDKGGVGLKIIQCSICVQDVRNMCARYAQYVCKMCGRSAQDVRNMCARIVQDVLNMCARCVQGVLNMCARCMHKSYLISFIRMHLEKR